MRIFISSDIEGCAGISDWDQVRIGAPEFALGRALLVDEVNAAVDGALAAGAEQVLVNDAHSTMHNLDPRALRPGVALLSGAHKPLYMMEGLHSGHDAVLMVAYHGSIGAERAILSHTYNPAAISEVRINGAVAGESGLNALVALHHGVPVCLVTGDDATADEARRFMPAIHAVVVKRSITRFAAESLHPEVARERIREGAEAAVRAAAVDRAAHLPRIALPATVEVDFLTADMAEQATLARGVRRTAARTVTTTGDDPLELYRRFTAMITLTGPLGGR